MTGSMGVDEHWNDITGWPCSLDSRYLPYADQQRAKHADDMFSIGATNAPVMCSKYEWFMNKSHYQIAFTKFTMIFIILISIDIAC